VTGIVLAGGRSERMGVAKALLRLNGETFLERAVALLGGMCKEIIIAASPTQPLPQIAGCRMVTDEKPGLGPLGGLVTALAASDDEWHLAVACDLPLARPEVLRLLAESAQDVDAIVPRTGGRLQTLLAAYSRTCLEPGREVLARGERAVAAMLDRVKMRVLEEEVLREADPALVSFVNVNTWEEYQAIRDRLSGRETCD
jgi:molybdopterin-guanine dinucleotide biosynthesis protein A